MKYRILIYISLLIFVSQNINAQKIDGDCDTTKFPEKSIRNCLLDSISVFMNPGGRVDILDGDFPKVAFDRPGKEGYYDVYVVDLEGGNEVCLTCNFLGLPQKHNGQPAWHPSGEWVVFQSEKEQHKGKKSRFSTPGRGVYNDLWITNKNGTEFFQLTDLPNEPGRGVLHPHFSNDGKKLSWCELYEKAHLKYKGGTFGTFKLKVADFIIDDKGTIRLENIKEFSPGEKVFYENHGFSPDGKKLLFTSNLYKNTSPFKGNKICLLDIETEELTVLADKGYNEHACYIFGGEYIIWGSNYGNKRKGMDYWIMKSDGSEHQRLTYFNQKGHPESSKKRLYTVDMSWSEEKKILLGFIQDRLVKDGGEILTFYFK